MNVIFLRHGLSQWNLENKFTGWVDVPLAKEGLEEANKAKELLKENNFEPGVVYTSYLKRAHQTADIVCDIEYIMDWRLNERHYGSLQGLDKKETAIKYSEEQVFLWRRSYSTTPPLLDKDSLENPNTSTMYQDIEEVLPLGESLHDVRVRVEPILDKILASAQSNKVLVVAHGNSIRAIQKILENIPDDEISHVNIPTCIPLAFDVSVKSGKRVVKRIGYLGDSEEVLRATKEVEQQSQINNKRD